MMDKLDSTEVFILKLISENGGEIPRDFFAQKLQGMVKKGAIETAFTGAGYGSAAILNSRFVYKLKGLEAKK